MRKLLVLCLVPLAACVGGIDGDVGEPDEPEAAAPGAAGGATGGSRPPPGAPGVPGAPGAPGVPPPPAAGCPVAPELLPVGLRRLTEAEYNATVRDLFPGVTLPRFDLAQEVDASGFENRARLQTPTALLVEQVGTAAAAIAERVARSPAVVLPCTPTPATEAACGAQFVDSFGARAFRRPLTDAEKQTYAGFFEQQRSAISFAAAMQLTLEAFLQAPAFLYRVEAGGVADGSGRVRLTGHELASRLSYLLWGTMPDAALLEAARTNRLSTTAEVETQARRMLKDGRLRGTMIELHRQWLDFDRLERESSKDPKLYPTFTPALQAAMREESDRFVEAVMVKGDGTIGSLLTSTTGIVDAGLARLYGAAPPATGWAQVALSPAERAGFLTRANFLASHAHALSGSPPLRAVFVMRRLLCAALPPPPNDADTTPPKPRTGEGPRTNRQLFEERTVGACQGCHNLIDPIGFGLEHYDAIGRYRTMDNGLPVDARGELKGVDVAGPFTGGVELSRRLATSAQVRLCATAQWYEYALGRDREESDDCKVKALEQSLAAAGGDVREMLVALVKTQELTHRRAP